MQVRHTSAWQNQESELKKQQKLQITQQDQLTTLHANIEEKTSELSQLSIKATDVESAHMELNNKVSSLQGQLLGFDMANNDNNDEQKGSLASQLMEAQRVSVEADGEIKQINIKTKHITTELNKKKKELKKGEKDFKALGKGSPLLIYIYIYYRAYLMTILIHERHHRNQIE